MPSSQRPRPAGLPPIADIVRRHDPDRFFCTLFAPRAAQPTLFALYAFNHELARAHEAAREPGLALIRLQWWREIAEGASRPHEVATPLAEALAAGALARPRLLAMIEAREAEVEPAATLADLLARLALGAGSLAEAAGEALGATAEEGGRLRGLGTGVGLAGLIRNVAAHARIGRCQIPTAMLAEAGLTAEAVTEDPNRPALAPAIEVLRNHARLGLGRPSKWRSGMVSAGLPAVLSRRDLGHAPQGVRGLGDRLAVVMAAARGMA